MGKETFDRVKEASDIVAYANAHMEDRGHGTYVCPACGSGNGPKHSAACHVKGLRWKCYSCGAGGDIFDLAGAVIGTDSKGEQLKEVAHFFNVPIDNEYSPKHTAKPAQKTEFPARPKPQPKDYTEARKKEAWKIRQAKKNLGDPEAVAYLEARGISLTKAWEWCLGYNSYTKRIVIPWKGCDYYHIDRDITGKSYAKYTKPSSDDVGPEPLYNADALNGDTCVVVEGVFDALAVMDLGFPAIALNKAGDAASARRILDLHPAARLLVLLDHDSPKDDGRTVGQEGQAALIQALQEDSDVEVITSEVLQVMGVKDPFEAWVKNKNALRIGIDLALAR